MDWTWIIIIAVFAATFGAVIFHKLDRRKPEPEPKKPVEPEFNLDAAMRKIEKFEAENKLHGVRITQEQHFKSFDDLFRQIPDIPDGGTFSPPLEELSVDGPGLYETNYTFNGDTWHIFFLVTTNLPEPDKPLPYVFPGINIIRQTEDSRVFKIKAPKTGGDLTAFVQSELDKFPSGTLLAPTVIEFEGEFWTEGTEEKGKSLKCALHVLNKKYFIIRGGSFYTKAPGHPFGGNISQNRYSHRRHFRFEKCRFFSIEPLEIRGSNYTDGERIGSSPEQTPSFWKLGAMDMGASYPGFPAYRSYWEFEHGLDFVSCENFFVGAVTIREVWGDGICIGVGNKNFVVQGAFISRVGRQEIAYYDCEKGLIDGVITEYGRRGGFDFEPFHKDGYVREVEIRNCSLHARQVIFPALGRGMVADIHIHDNEWQTTGATIICADSTGQTRRKNIAIRNNRRIGAFGSPAAIMKFYMVDNLLIENNIDHVVGSQSRTACQFENCIGVVERNNDFGSAEKHIIRNSEVEAELELVEF